MQQKALKNECRKHDIVGRETYVGSEFVGGVKYCRDCDAVWVPNKEKTKWIRKEVKNG